MGVSGFCGSRPLFVWFLMVCSSGLKSISVPFRGNLQRPPTMLGSLRGRTSVQTAGRVLTCFISTAKTKPTKKKELSSGN